MSPQLPLKTWLLPFLAIASSGLVSVMAYGLEAIRELCHYVEYPDGRVKKIYYVGEKSLTADQEETFVLKPDLSMTVIPMDYSGEKPKEGKPFGLKFTQYTRSLADDEIGTLEGKDEFGNKVRIRFLRSHFEFSASLRTLSESKSVLKTDQKKFIYKKWQVIPKENLIIKLPFNSPANELFPASEEASE